MQSLHRDRSVGGSIVSGGGEVLTGLWQHYRVGLVVFRVGCVEEVVPSARLFQLGQDVALPEQHILALVIHVDLGASVLGQQDAIALLDADGQVASSGRIAGTGSDGHHQALHLLGHRLLRQQDAAGSGRLHLEALDQDAVQHGNHLLNHVGHGPEMENVFSLLCVFSLITFTVTVFEMLHVFSFY